MRVLGAAGQALPVLWGLAGFSPGSPPPWAVSPQALHPCSASSFSGDFLRLLRFCLVRSKSHSLFFCLLCFVSLEESSSSSVFSASRQLPSCPIHPISPFSALFLIFRDSFWAPISVLCQYRPLTMGWSVRWRHPCSPQGPQDPGLSSETGPGVLRAGSGSARGTGAGAHLARRAACTARPAVAPRLPALGQGLTLSKIIYGPIAHCTW